MNQVSEVTTSPDMIVLIQTFGQYIVIPICVAVVAIAYIWLVLRQK